jgi:hypothetical protein
MKKAIAGWPAAVLLILVLSACSPYDTYRVYTGPELTEDQVGTLYVMTKGVYVVQVDDQEAPRGFGSDQDQTQRIYLPPGRHSITVRYSSSLKSWPGVYTTASRGAVTLTHIFEAGRRYSLQAEIGYSDWHPSIRRP